MSNLPVCFSGHGINVDLSSNNTVVDRVKSNDNGIVFTMLPIPLDVVFQVKILNNKGHWCGGLGLGMTTCHPYSIEMPSDVMKLSHAGNPDYWIMISSTTYHNGDRRHFRVNLDHLREGQTIGCRVSRNGELHLYVDGVDRGFVWTGLPTQKRFWGLVDVYGKVQQVQILESINATSQISHPVHPTTGLGRVPDSVFELKISHLQEEMILLQKQCIYYQQKNTQFRKEVTHYQQEISHSQQQNTHLQQENTHLQQESIRLQQSSIQLQQSNTLLQKENTQLKPEKARFQQMNTWFKHENTLLQQKNAQLQQKNTRLKPKNIPLQQENAQLQQENTRLQQENTWLQQENTQLKPENTRLQQENARLQQENTQLKPINTRLQQKNTWLQQENNQLKPAKTRLQQEKAQLQQENNQLKLAKTQLQQENAQLQQENTRLKPVNAQLQQENAQLQQENTQLKPVNTRLQQENTQLQQENTWLKPVNTQLQQENTQLRQEKTRLQQKNTNLQETVGRIQLLNTELQSKLDNQPKLGSDADISFWVVSHDEVKFTDRVLGEGGWGKVVVGSFRGQDVAVKQLHSLICSSDYFKDLFRREISIMAKVRHPNLLLFVAAVLDSPSKTPNIITELLDTNLRQAYHNGQLASNPVRLCILRDVSAALNYLHLQQNPIVHRDVSSANVLLQALPKRMWKGKLSDFGSANLLQFATTPGPGTAIYTAPEVFKGEQTPKMDVYSYGKLLCEVLTNRLPDPYAFPSMVQSMAENWPLMHQLISSCVEQDPTKRPPMSYIVEHLNQFTKRAK